jgi:hypothetical protein
MAYKLTQFGDSVARRILAQMQAEDAGKLRPIRQPATIYEPNFQPDNSLPDTKQRERTEALAAGGEGKAPRPGLRHCRFTLRRFKLLDVDAKYASVKDLLDCLTIAGVIRGDKEGEITLEVVQEKVKHGDVEQTVIEVFE